jgi:hypothetical protein
MPLKISSFSPSNLAVLNNWASAQENQVNSHQSQLADLNGRINALLKSNPSLVNPSSQ